ncbi:unnamed protein product [Clonostachys byssicola]|uniref:Peptidase S8/S53 domain-containing protein n=1 Tax=Clonostachys byssicola TaxID=160290 RepID=A0A9N9U1V4_9HYPO|nr:unnamed protein product [Clonostachys byssicola]
MPLDAPPPCADAETKGWDKTFSPLATLKMIEERGDSDLMEKILTTTNNKGDSLFTECRLRKDLNQDFRSYLKRLIFDKVKKVPDLRKVSIDVILLKSTKDYYDEETRKQHENMTLRYAYRLKDHAKRKNAYELEVKHNAKWYYPLASLDPDETAAQVLQHPFTGQLKSFFSTLEELLNRNSRTEAGNITEEQMQIERLCGLALHPNDNPFADPDSKPQDRRIKVAIIDNGADRVRFAYRHLIAKGQSYVNAEVTGSDRLLPWWMVSDPHGTQMASLIGQTNPYCSLYVARVGRGRNDIQPEAATKAIHWAIENCVDIISISWTLNKANAELNKAIESAYENGIIVFCSTADEGALSNAEPVGQAAHVLTVSATDQWGHLTSKATSSRKVDVLVPVENIDAPAPDYMINQSNTVSGSSVATALAAGIASLALLMLRAFNGEEWDDEMKDASSAYHMRNRIKNVFGLMAEPNTAIKLTRLFSNGSDYDTVLDELIQRWQKVKPDNS